MKESEPPKGYGTGTENDATTDHVKEEPAEDTGSCLDCIPGLQGDTDRQGFVRKVYCLVAIMMCIPSFLIIMAANVEPMRLFMIHNLWLYYLCTVLVLVMLFSLCCFGSVLKKVPANYIFLFTFTILESYTVTTLTCFYTTKGIIYAAILTAVMVISLSLYACFSKTDLTTLMWPLFWVSLAVTLSAMILMLIIRSYYLTIVLCWIFLILGALYLIVDTQWIMGSRSNEAGLDDYVLASLILFLDIIRIFVYLLAILGQRR